MRSFSIAFMLKDEIDAWPITVGKDGDPDTLSDERCTGYYDKRKIFRGSTPTIEGESKIWKAFKRGDQRVYKVLCRSCNYPQHLRWKNEDKETGVVGGFVWETEGGILIPDSVRYCCVKCGHPHHEHDKTKLFSDGAYWEPTAKPKSEGIRSYHLPALYSPVGQRPWSQCVESYLDSYDDAEGQAYDLGKFQVFYNNILAQPFRAYGAEITEDAVSAHKRDWYRYGQIPNKMAELHCGSHVMLVTCQVDVHKKNLDVAVMGWTIDAKCFVIEYKQIKPLPNSPTCDDVNSSAWEELREFISTQEYIADDGKHYGIVLTLIDSGWQPDTVVTFCKTFAGGVHPIIGAHRPKRSQRIVEFAKFQTQLKTTGYRIIVDHYKDRLAPVLKREWMEGVEQQRAYHFNVPRNVTKAQLKELTVEFKEKVTDDAGNSFYVWKRPPGARNELWDLLVYGHAALEIIAWDLCVEVFELETVDWNHFWRYIEQNKLYYSEAHAV